MLPDGCALTLADGSGCVTEMLPEGSAEKEGSTLPEGTTLLDGSALADG